MQSLIISASTSAGVNINGADMGAIKLGKYVESLNKNVLYIENSHNFIKDMDINNKRKNENEINSFNKKLYETIIKNSQKFTLTIGGDHSISIGSALASAKKNGNIGVIWFDAHADFNTFETTITGNIHGLPLATIVGFGNDDLKTFYDGNLINNKNVVIIGARSIDELELLNLKEAGIKVFTTNDIKELGIEFVFNEALKILSNTDGIHFSIDLDVIDPKIAPGVSVKEDNGIKEEDVLKSWEIMKKENVVSLDLVEFNPNYDKEDKTFNIGKKLLDDILITIDNK